MNRSTPILANYLRWRFFLLFLIGLSVLIVLIAVCLTRDGGAGGSLLATQTSEGPFSARSMIREAA